MRWPLTITGILQLLIAALLATAGIGYRMSYASTHPGASADAALSLTLIATAIAFSLSGLGVLLGKTWGRIIAIVSALVLVALFAIAIIINMGESRPEPVSRFGNTLVIAVTVSQFFALFVLIFAWKRPSQGIEERALTRK